MWSIPYCGLIVFGANTLQVPQSICAKNYENWLNVDKVIAMKMNWCSFLAHPVYPPVANFILCTVYVALCASAKIYSNWLSIAKVIATLRRLTFLPICIVLFRTKLALSDKDTKSKTYLSVTQSVEQKYKETLQTENI